MKQKMLLLGLFAGCASIPAFAAPSFGPFVGVQAGVADRSGSGTVAGRSLKGSKTDAVYGAFAGYDMMMGQAVAGVQAEIGGASGTIKANDGAGTFSDFDPKWGYALSTRLGFLVSPRALVYGRVGYAAERVREVFGGPTILIVAIPPKAKWLGGLQYGGGTELAVSRRLSVRAEYRRNDYSSRYKANQFLAGAAVHF